MNYRLLYTGRIPFSLTQPLTELWFAVRNVRKSKTGGLANTSYFKDLSKKTGVTI